MSHAINKQNSNALEAKETNLGLRAWYIKEEPVTMGQFLPLQATQPDICQTSMLLVS